MVGLSSNALAGKCILVTGASGFIGSRLCRHLYSAGAEVHGISRVPRTVVEGIHRWWEGDVCDLDEVRRLVSTIRPAIMFHLAGDSRSNRLLDLVLPTFGNLASTVNLLIATTEIQCERIILAGSLDEPEPSDAPSSPYAAAHVAIQAYAKMFYRIFGTPSVIARMFMTYGPGQRAVQKLIPYVALSLLRGESPKLSSGERLVDWIYVDDLVEGLLALAQAPGIEGSTIDLGSGTLISIRMVVQELVRLIGTEIAPVFGALPERPMEQSRIADIGETFKRTGWNPHISLTEGLRRTIAWYRAGLKAQMAKGA